MGNVMSENIAIVFPGQGSQSLGMLDSLSQKNKKVSLLLEEASSALSYDVAKLISEGPIEKLNQTEYTQVAMLVADVSYYCALQDANYTSPLVMAGHSLGEYAALVCAESLSFSDAVTLVSLRGKTMQKTIPQGSGAMADVIGMKDSDLETVCKASSNTNEQVVPANYNAIGQTVIAGHVNAVNKAISLACESGAMMAKILPVSVPCHCSLLKPAADLFSSLLDEVEFKSPIVPVLSNIDACPYTDSSDIRQRLTNQLFQPVQWVNTIKAFSSMGIEKVIECGPGKTLSGLIKRTDKSLKPLLASDIINTYS